MMVRAASIATPPTRLRLVVPGILSERPRALRFVVGICRAHGLSTDVEHALVSAFGEAFNQAVLYSYRDVAGTLAIEVEVAARDRVSVMVRDRGAGPDGGSGDVAERRYGLFIMLRAMDEVRWWKDGDENVVAMVKHLPRS
jgi:anti-sigma regulatory factor (Ser/Thr protein kinase)